MKVLVRVDVGNTEQFDDITHFTVVGGHHLTLYNDMLAIAIFDKWDYIRCMDEVVEPKEGDEILASDFRTTRG